MARLRRGVTGFITDLSDKKDAVSFDEFQADMNQLARALNGKVVSCIPFDTTENYFQSLLSVNDKEYCLLCNTVFPYIGICVADPQNHQRKFIMSDAIASHLFGMRNYELLGPDFLHQKISQVELAELGFDELKEVQRKKPFEMNQIIFNEWE